MGSDLKQRAVVARTKLALHGVSDFARMTDEACLWYYEYLKNGGPLTPGQWGALGVTWEEIRAKGLWMKDDKETK